jgi:hypothetical protein
MPEPIHLSEGLAVELFRFDSPEVRVARWRPVAHRARKSASLPLVCLTPGSAQRQSSKVRTRILLSPVTASD